MSRCKKYDCSCYEPYPNKNHEHKNGKWKCKDKYEQVEWKPRSIYGCVTHCRRKEQKDDNKRGIGHNCLSDAYDLGKTAGKAEGYHKAENDYFAKTQKDIENAYNRGYEVGYEVGKTYEREEWKTAAGEMIMKYAGDI